MLLIFVGVHFLFCSFVTIFIVEGNFVNLGKKIGDILNKSFRDNHYYQDDIN